MSLLLLTLLLTAPSEAAVASRGEWVATPVETLADVPGFAAAEQVERSRYGGWKAKRFKATGFFRTHHDGARWWLVDPEGYAFLTVGVCSVTRAGVTADEAVAAGVFGSPEAWAKATAGLLLDHGFNSLGCWSEAETFQAAGARIPYFPRWNFMSTYKNQRDPADGPRGYPNECMPLFDDAFEAFCLQHAQQLAATKDDPWLVGHFSDNELPFRPDLLDLYLGLPETDSGHRAAAAWLKDDRAKSGRGADAAIVEAEQDGFLEFAADRYYRLVAAAIHAHDPNHLYVGSRIHGRCIRPATFRGARHTDIVSVNYYHRWSPEQERMAGWVEASGRPFLISEWYAMALDRADLETGGAGFRVKTRSDRGMFYQNMTLGLLRNPGCIGWHWFKYGGDRAGVDMGLVDLAYAPKLDLLGQMAELNRQVYPLADHLR